MNQTSDKNSVSRSTFEKWAFAGDFTVEADDLGIIRRLTCNVCTEHEEVIMEEARRRKMRKLVIDGMCKYIRPGIDHAHKGSVLKHIKGDTLHAWAKQQG